VVDKPLTAWTLSRRFRLAPSPVPGEAAPGDRLAIAGGRHPVLACCARGDVRLFSADGREWTRELAPIVAALRKLRIEAVIEGFACALDSDGKPTFEALRAQVARKKPARLVFAGWD